MNPYHKLFSVLRAGASSSLKLRTQIFSSLPLGSVLERRRVEIGAAVRPSGPSRLNTICAGGQCRESLAKVRQDSEDFVVGTLLREQPCRQSW